MISAARDARQPLVVQFVNTLAVNDGGPALAAAELHWNLRARGGIDSHLLALRHESLPQVTDSGLQDQADPGEGVEFLSFGRAGRMQTFALVLRAIRSSDCVLIHGYYLWWAPVIGLLAQLLGKKCYLLPHGSLTARQQQFSRGKKMLFDVSVGRLLRHCLTAFVVASPPEMDDVQRKFSGTTVLVARLGVTTAAGPPAPAPFHKPLRLLSMSRLAPKKRIDLMLRALYHLQAAGVDARLSVAGEGSHAMRSQLEGLARELQIEQRVDFVGQVTGTDKDRLYAMSDVLLLPSDDENFGIAPIEAMMHGCPVVVSSHVASTLPLAGAGCAVLEPPSPSRIAEVLDEWATGSQQEQLARRAHAVEAAEAMYSWESVIHRDWCPLLRGEGSEPCSHGSRFGERQGGAG